MRSTLSVLLIIALIIFALGNLGCGNNASNPATPSPNGLELADCGAGTDGNMIIGVYDLVFDPETMALELVESRNADTHYDITTWAAHHASVSGVSWDPATRILNFDLTISNTTIYDIFDLRVLMLADPASGFELKNPDDYTKLFSPFAPDVVNPFRAYAKSAPNRIFAGGSSHTEHFTVQYPPVVVLPARLLCECSWPGNCEDVYEISNQTLSGPISTTVSGTITLDAYDHQDDIGQVYVDTTPITGGLTWLANMGGTTWSGSLFNSAGAPAAKYMCMITAHSLASAWDTYDFIEIEVVPGTPVTSGWVGTDYTINGGCNLDLGVIADPGGPRDSEIVMAQTEFKTCDLIVKYGAYYAGYSNYISLYDYDPANANYQPYPVVRLDAADDGAFSFTNENWTLPFPSAGSHTYNAQVWSVFDRTPMLQTGPMPADGRYWLDYTKMDAMPYPADVCDDFTLGQYALFTTGATYTPRDLVFIGTMPDKYTHDKVRYVANLDPWAGMGTGMVDPGSICGIDVIEYVDEYEKIAYTRLYVLEDSLGTYQVEVFQITDTAPGMGDDTVSHFMTIDIDYLHELEIPIIGHDIEILPVNSHYDLNPNYPTVCVLVSLFGASSASSGGEVLLYNALTGAFLESIGDAAKPAMPDSDVHYLDTDDGDWEIHVTRTDAAGNVLATVFEYI